MRLRTIDYAEAPVTNPFVCRAWRETHAGFTPSSHADCRSSSEGDGARHATSAVGGSRSRSRSAARHHDSKGTAPDDSADVRGSTGGAERVGEGLSGAGPEDGIAPRSPEEVMCDGEAQLGQNAGRSCGRGDESGSLYSLSSSPEAAQAEACALQAPCSAGALAPATQTLVVRPPRRQPDGTGSPLKGK